MTYSIIVPVFNRPDEVDELLESLCQQTVRDFEVVVVEDGSENTCKDVCYKYHGKLDLKYFAKKNSGPGWNYKRFSTSFQIKYVYMASW